MNYRNWIAALSLASLASAQTVTIKGRVLGISGEPIQGATCQFKNLSNKTMTDAQGNFDFANATAISHPVGYAISMASQGRMISVDLERPGRIALDLFNLSGRFLRSVADEEMPAGMHLLPFAPPAGSRQLYLLRMRAGSQTTWHKLAIQDGFASLTGMESASSSVTAARLAKVAATDSLFCTEPGHYGGLTKINGRAINAYTGSYDLRMFSSDPAWKTQCGMPITFNFDNSAGVARYKQLIPDWVATEAEVLLEVCQATFKKPTQPKKYATYVANIKSGAGGSVAATGGNTLGFSTEYIAGQPNNYSGWWELVGVQVHEAVHSYQAYYNTTGADGFGEAMPDAVRALTGFFNWPKGTKCTGSYKDVYQTGAKYWYFIEMKHPGFLTSVWQQTQGDISARVQSITGESLSDMVTECQTKGMP
jgi:hypothetical protein